MNKTKYCRLWWLLTPIALVACQPQTPYEAPPALSVRTISAERTPYVETYTLTGEIVAQQELSLGFQNAGTVQSVLVNVGDEVAKGALLAQVDNALATADLATANANLRAARAQYQVTASQYTRQKDLKGQGFVSQAALDTARSARSSAYTGLNAAKARVAAAKIALTDTDLIAEESGIITKKWVEAGELVQSAQAVVDLAVDGPREASFDVSEAAFYKNISAKDITLKLVEIPEITATATVKEISPVVNAVDGTVNVKTSVDEPSKAVPLGAAVSILARTEPVWSYRIPWGAVDSHNGQVGVWLVDAETSIVEFTPVEITTYTDKDVIVSQGVTVGNEVVIEGLQFLTKGVLVNPVRQNEESL